MWALLTVVEHRERVGQFKLCELGGNDQVMNAKLFNVGTKQPASPHPPTVSLTCWIRQSAGTLMRMPIRVTRSLLYFFLVVYFVIPETNYPSFVLYGGGSVLPSGSCYVYVVYCTVPRSLTDPNVS